MAGILILLLHEKHAHELMQAGATAVIPETLETGLQLSGIVLQTLGVAETTTLYMVQTERERRIAYLRSGVADGPRRKLPAP